MGEIIPNEYGVMDYENGMPIGNFVIFVYWGQKRRSPNFNTRRYFKRK